MQPNQHNEGGGDGHVEVAPVVEVYGNGREEY